MIGSEIPKDSFELWRQDDNGLRFLIGSFSDRQSAERRLAELTRCQHKQTYWIAIKNEVMPLPKTQNLFSAIPQTLPDEFCEVLCRSDRVRIERIVSQGHRSAEGFWYDQPTDEFVLLVSGRATIEFADAPEPVTLHAGDWLEIKAHTRHRVSWTAPGQQTVWLAVHY